MSTTDTDLDGGVDIDACVALLEAHGVPLDPGLRAEQLLEIERRLGFVFSPDHRRLLTRVQPAGEHWLHWTKDSPESIRARLDWPLEGCWSTSNMTTSGRSAGAPGQRLYASGGGS